jgi:hypothetical protein
MLPGCNGGAGEPDATFTRAFFLRKSLDEAVREAAMKRHTVEAVLRAADEWVSAQEALVAAKQVSNETEAEQEAADIAGSRLVIAVTRWRSERGTG